MVIGTTGFRYKYLVLQRLRAISRPGDDYFNSYWIARVDFIGHSWSENFIIGFLRRLASAPLSRSCRRSRLSDEMARVVLAMSGGVDSSVAAHLLLEQGHDVVGVFMRHGEQSPVACTPDPTHASSLNSSSLAIVDVSTAKGSTAKAEAVASGDTKKRPDHKQGCCTAADAEDARRVADRLSIPFYALDLQQEFNRIIDYFVDEYSHGRTPNPCVQCNNWIKFGKLFEYADSIEAAYVATGHYARIEPLLAGPPALLRGRDAHKDQSYVLFGIERKFLRRMLLPVGAYEKEAIRALATRLGLQVADKKESQEICFVTQGRYDQFVRARQAIRSRQGQSQRGQSQRGQSQRDHPRQDPRDTAGELVATNGTVLGRHEGIERFTVGQRKGLGVALGQRQFVVRIEPDTRRVVLGDRSALERSELTANGTNWLVEPSAIPRHCQVQIRYNAAPVAAEVELLPERRLWVRFERPQWAVAPGQAVVCYDHQRTLGGGWIESS